VAVQTLGVCLDHSYPPCDLDAEHVLAAHALIHGREGMDLREDEFFCPWLGFTWANADGDIGETLLRLRERKYGIRACVFLADLLTLREKRDPLWYLRERAASVREMAKRRRLREAAIRVVCEMNSDLTARSAWVRFRELCLGKAESV
jgi:hypothetical protein